MKKTTLLLLILVTVMAFNFPQYCSAQGLSLGIKGGMNMANVTGSDVNNTDSYMGIAAGAYATIGLLPNIAIQPELLYSQKGFQTSGEILGYTYEQKSHINYMEIPVLAKISFGAIIKPYVLAGPYFATKLGVSSEYTLNGVSTSSTDDAGIASSDMGLTFGAGVQTPVKLSLEARYSMGLSSIDDSDWNLDVKNSNISLMVGFALF